MSITGPSTSALIALHSMCHPGRPGPHGESQLTSPSLAAYKRLNLIPRTSACRTTSVQRRIKHDKLAYPRGGCHRIARHFEVKGRRDSLRTFHSAKSALFFLRSSTATRSPARLSSCTLCTRLG
jgi:hypothetical protein